MIKSDGSFIVGLHALFHLHFLFQVQNNPSTVDAIHQLVVNLKRVQSAQNDNLILFEKQNANQVKANEIFSKLVPTLELIHSSLHSSDQSSTTALKVTNKKDAKNVVLLPKLCNELRYVGKHTCHI